MRWRVLPAAVALLCATGLASSAEERDRVRPEDMGSRPIEITADRLSADSGRNSVVFEGTVVAKQGDVTLACDRLYAEYSRPAGMIETITAEGNVKVTQAGREARAARGIFHNMEQRIVLTGGAELTQGGNVLKGDSVTIFLRENRSTMTGGDGGRVRAVINPRSAPDAKAGGGR